MRGENGSRMEKHFHAVGNRFHSGNDFTVEKRPLKAALQMDACTCHELLGVENKFKIAKFTLLLVFLIQRMKSF